MLTTLVTNILDPLAVGTLNDHLDRGGRLGLVDALSRRPAEVRDIVVASGLRGRGGGGFPTGAKWNAVAASGRQSRVVVNAAEGEPGSHKDRSILERNPFRVIEGALICAYAVEASRVSIVLKDGNPSLRRRVEIAIAELRLAGWFTGGAEVEVVVGPSAYLLGEETAMLEVLEGRRPFPRIRPPYEDGLSESERTSTQGERNADDAAPPAVVNNVETLAHVSWLFAHGVDAFRSLGTADSPGTLVVTVSGDVAKAAVAEVPMGTRLREVIDHIGGGVPNGIGVVLNGVSHRALTEDDLDTPLTWEHMEAIGSGLGASGFIVFDATKDPRSIAAGVARFLAVESCGQCRPCKHDGVAISDALVAMPQTQASDHQIVELDDRLRTVTDGARCSLAGQIQTVVRSLLDLGAGRRDWPDQATPIAPIVAIDDGRAHLDEQQADKQPDWSHGADWNGQAPAETA